MSETGEQILIKDERVGNTERAKTASRSAKNRIIEK